MGHERRGSGSVFAGKGADRSNGGQGGGTKLMTARRPRSENEGKYVDSDVCRRHGVRL